MKFSVLSSILLLQNRSCLSSYGIHGLLVCDINKIELSQNSLDSAKLSDDFFLSYFCSVRNSLRFRLGAGAADPGGLNSVVSHPILPPFYSWIYPRVLMRIFMSIVTPA